MQSVPGFSMFDTRRVAPEKSPVCKVVNSFLQETVTANSIRTVSKRGRTKFNVYLVIRVVTIHIKIHSKGKDLLSYTTVTIAQQILCQ